jgi:hypothetical protein
VTPLCPIPLAVLKTNAPSKADALAPMRLEAHSELAMFLDLINNGPLSMPELNSAVVASKLLTPRMKWDLEEIIRARMLLMVLQRPQASSLSILVRCDRTRVL